MSDSRFSGTPGTGAPGSADPYGFFAQPTQQPDGGFAQQGAPSSGTATPFGAPSGAPFGAPVAPFGSPPPYAAPYSTTRPGPSGRHGARVAGLVVVALVVLAGAWYGWRVWEHHQPVHVPTMLGGLPAASDPRVTSAAAQIQQGMQKNNPGIQLEVRAYSDGKGRVLFAGAARGRTDVAKDMGDVGAQVGPVQHVGGSTCASAKSVGVTLCERSEGDLTVMAMSVESNGKAEAPATVAALVDQIWSTV